MPAVPRTALGPKASAALLPLCRFKWCSPPGWGTAGHHSDRKSPWSGRLGFWGGGVAASGWPPAGLQLHSSLVARLPTRGDTLGQCPSTEVGEGLLTPEAQPCSSPGRTPVTDAHMASGTVPSGPPALRGLGYLLSGFQVPGPEPERERGHSPPPPHQPAEGSGRGRQEPRGGEGAVCTLPAGPGLRDVTASAKGEGAGLFFWRVGAGVGQSEAGRRHGAAAPSSALGAGAPAE